MFIEEDADLHGYQWREGCELIVAINRAGVYSTPSRAPTAMRSPKVFSNANYVFLSHNTKDEPQVRRSGEAWLTISTTTYS